MTFSMDLNASPLPEDDEQQPYEEAVEVDYAQEGHVESAVAKCVGYRTVFSGVGVCSTCRAPGTNDY